MKQLAPELDQFHLEDGSHEIPRWIWTCGNKIPAVLDTILHITTCELMCILVIFASYQGSRFWWKCLLSSLQEEGTPKLSTWQSCHLGDDALEECVRSDQLVVTSLCAWRNPPIWAPPFSWAAAGDDRQRRQWSWYVCGLWHWSLLDDDHHTGLLWVQSRPLYPHNHLIVTCNRH